MATRRTVLAGAAGLATLGFGAPLAAQPGAANRPAPPPGTRLVLLGTRGQVGRSPWRAVQGNRGTARQFLRGALRVGSPRFVEALEARLRARNAISGVSSGSLHDGREYGAGKGDVELVLSGLDQRARFAY